MVVNVTAANYYTRVCVALSAALRGPWVIGDEAFVGGLTLLPPVPVSLSFSSTSRWDPPFLSLFLIFSVQYT